MMAGSVVNACCDRGCLESSYGGFQAAPHHTICIALALLLIGVPLGAARGTPYGTGSCAWLCRHAEAAGGGGMAAEVAAAAAAAAVVPGMAAAAAAAAAAVVRSLVLVRLMRLDDGGLELAADSAEELQYLQLMCLH